MPASFVKLAGVKPGEMPTAEERAAADLLDRLLAQDPPDTAFHVRRCCQQMAAAEAPHNPGMYHFTCPVHGEHKTSKRLRQDD